MLTEMTVVNLAVDVTPKHSQLVVSRCRQTLGKSTHPHLDLSVLKKSVDHVLWCITILGLSCATPQPLPPPSTQCLRRVRPSGFPTPSLRLAFSWRWTCARLPTTDDMLNREQRKKFPPNFHGVAPQEANPVLDTWGEGR